MRRAVGLWVAIGTLVWATGVAAAVCTPPPPLAETEQRLVRLGWHLFYDPLLSGNRSVACATCHHPRHATSDGVALGIGDGGIGLGPQRRADPANLPEQRIPRHAPALFNLGYPGFQVMFHDGRVERLDDGRIRTPMGERAGSGAFPVLSALSLFPLVSPDEMAGHYGENPVARAVRQGLIAGPGGAWQKIAARVEAIPAYAARFRAALDTGRAVAIGDITRALAAFMATEWRADQSAFDRYLCEGIALPADAERGRALFYGTAGCAACHAGRFQTDHAFHAIAMVQIGPGKAARFETHARDTGRARVTGRESDRYRFRTPSLRNVARTAPYGHAGAYATLEQVVRHHLDPLAGLEAFERAGVRLAPLDGAQDFRVLDDGAERAAIAAASGLSGRRLADDAVRDLLAFLHALSDRQSLRGRLGVPTHVPSGLPVP